MRNIMRSSSLCPVQIAVGKALSAHHGWQKGSHEKQIWTNIQNFLDVFQNSKTLFKLQMAGNTAFSPAKNEKLSPGDSETKTKKQLFATEKNANNPIFQKYLQNAIEKLSFLRIIDGIGINETLRKQIKLAGDGKKVGDLVRSITEEYMKLFFLSFCFCRACQPTKKKMHYGYGVPPAQKSKAFAEIKNLTFWGKEFRRRFSEP
ncbi:MAG: hypothetical protein GY714_01000 [Desulfobacterales bacterium]|nr:hypothetical protein [Desulfobacterales bacterium]